METTKKERLAYHTPQVSDYGSVTQITCMAVSHVSPTTDGGTYPTNRTH